MQKRYQFIIILFWIENFSHDSPNSSFLMECLCWLVISRFLKSCVMNGDKGNLKQIIVMARPLALNLDISSITVLCSTRVLTELKTVPRTYSSNVLFIFSMSSTIVIEQTVLFIKQLSWFSPSIKESKNFNKFPYPDLIIHRLIKCHS